MKRLPGACHLKDALALRSARPSCANSRSRSALQCRLAYGQLSNVAWPKHQCSVINARVKFRQLWRRFSLVQSYRLIPVPIEAQAYPGPRSCTACDMRMSARETFFCWWERRREHSSFARTLGAAVGRSVVPISTGTVFTRWPTMPAGANTAYGFRRRVIGVPSCDPATISGRAGPIRSKPPFDFPPIRASP